MTRTTSVVSVSREVAGIKVLVRTGSEMTGREMVLIVGCGEQLRPFNIADAFLCNWTSRMEIAS